MIIQCDSCRTRFRLDDSKIKPQGVRVRCTKCQNVFVVSPPPSADDVEVEEVFGIPKSGAAPRGGESEDAPGAGEEARGAEPGGAGFEGLDFSFGVDRSASDEGGAAAGEAGVPGEEPEGADSVTAKDEPQEDAAGYVEEDTGPGGEEMPDFGAGIGGEDFGGEDEAPDQTPSRDEEDFGGWVDEGGDDAAPGAPEGPGGLLDDELAGAGTEGYSSEEVPDDGGEERAAGVEIPGPGTAEAASAEEGPFGDEGAGGGGLDEGPAGEGGGEGGGPFDDFDLSFTEEGEEDRPGAGGEEGPSGDGEDDWDLGSVGSGPEGRSRPDEPFEGPEEADEREAAEDAADEGLGDSSAPEGEEEEGEGYHGFEAVYQQEQEEPATGGAGGDGPDEDDSAKKVIPFSPGVKKGEERVDSTREFSDVFNHVISREEVFNSSVAIDENDYEGEFEMDDEEMEAARSGPARPSRLRLGLLIAGLIIVLGGGGLYASGVIDALTRAIVSGPAAVAGDNLGIERLNGYVVENGKFGALFAIEAVVKNKTDEPQEIRSIRGVLTGKGGTLSERSVSPGRVLSSDDLKNLPKAAIERHFSDPSGGTIPPRGIIPVMVVFTDIPAGVDEFGIDIVR